MGFASELFNTKITIHIFSQSFRECIGSEKEARQKRDENI